MLNFFVFPRTPTRRQTPSLELLTRGRLPRSLHVTLLLAITPTRSLHLTARDLVNENFRGGEEVKDRHRAQDVHPNKKEGVHVSLLPTLMSTGALRETPVSIMP